DSRKHVFVTNPDHVPTYHQQASDLWSRAYFERQAHKIGLHTVEAIISVVDRQRIEAQGYRTCRNMLDIAQGDNNRTLPERACQHVVAQDISRPATYTAVKQRMAALRAQAAPRPTPGAAQFGVPLE